MWMMPKPRKADIEKLTAVSRIETSGPSRAPSDSTSARARGAFFLQFSLLPSVEAPPILASPPLLARPAVRMLPLLGTRAHYGVSPEWLNGLVALGTVEGKSHSRRREFDAIASQRPPRRRRIDADVPTITTPEPSPNLDLLSNTFL